MAGFLDPTFESSLTGLPNGHGTQTLDYTKNVLKGILFASLSVSTRTVTGQIKYGDGSNKAAVVSVNIHCDQAITVNTGTLVTTGNASIQINTNSSGVFQVTIAGSQGATVLVSVTGGVSQIVLVGSGGTGGGGGGGGGISGITVKDEGSTVTGGPHTALNFVGAGVSVADAGGGQATVTIGAAGGYAGTWAAGTYNAGAIVRRGPFLFGTTQSTSIDPCDISNVGSPSDWTLVHTGAGLQSGNIARLTNNGISQSAVIYRTTTMATWDKKRIICDALAGPSSGADGIFFGFYDSSLALTPTTPFSAGFGGVFIDIYNLNTQSAVEVIVNGVSINTVTVANSGQITGNEILETTRYYRYYVDFLEAGANWTVTLWRDSYDLNTAAGIDTPGFLATWTVTKPTYTTCRAAAGAFTGGIAGLFKVRNFFVLDRSGVWDTLAEFPHAPRIDTAAF